MEQADSQSVYFPEYSASLKNATRLYYDYGSICPLSKDRLEVYTFGNYPVVWDSLCGRFKAKDKHKHKGAIQCPTQLHGSNFQPLTLSVP